MFVIFNQKNMRSAEFCSCRYIRFTQYRLRRHLKRFNVRTTSNCLTISLSSQGLRFLACYSLGRKFLKIAGFEMTKLYDLKWFSMSNNQTKFHTSLSYRFYNSFNSTTG